LNRTYPVKEHSSSCCTLGDTELSITCTNCFSKLGWFSIEPETTTASFHGWDLFLLLLCVCLCVSGRVMKRCQLLKIKLVFCTFYFNFWIWNISNTHTHRHTHAGICRPSVLYLQISSFTSGGSVHYLFPFVCLLCVNVFFQRVKNIRVCKSTLNIENNI